MEGSATQFEDDNAVTAASIFASSFAAFRDTLSDQQRKDLDQEETVEETFSRLQQRCSKHKDGNRILRCSEKLQTFAKSFKPYFQIIDVFVQVKPEWLAIFWGSFRLIMQVRWLTLKQRRCVEMSM